MVWFVLSFIALLTTAVMLAVLGGGGGVILLVALNGFSESQATPILACAALFVGVLIVATTTAVNALVAKKWFAEQAIPLWLHLTLALSILMAVVICLVGVVLVGV